MEFLDQRRDQIIRELGWLVPIVIFAIKIDLSLKQGFSILTSGLVQRPCRNLNRLKCSILLLLLDCDDHLTIPLTLTMAMTALELG